MRDGTEMDSASFAKSFPMTSCLLVKDMGIEF